MERLARLPLLVAALAGLASAAPARATVFLTPARALEEAFPGARCVRRATVLTEAQAREVQRRAQVRVTSKLVTEYNAWRGDTLVGTAYFDTRTVRTMPATFLVVVRPDSTVGRVEILAFHEPPDYQPPRRWLDTFERRRLSERLRPRGDVRNLSGATLSSRAVAESVRLALALHAVLPAASRPAGTSR